MYTELAFTVMRPLMLECIAGGREPSPALKEKVDRYIDESTGIQTVYQMEWLAAEVAAAGGPQRDKWWYKAEYNRRLMEYIAAKKNALISGAVPPETYRIAGAAQFLCALKNAGVDLYLASGTDHADVCEEARLVGVYDLFTEVRGAPAHAAACSKEAVLRLLFEEKGLRAAACSWWATARWRSPSAGIPARIRWAPPPTKKPAGA